MRQKNSAEMKPLQSRGSEDTVTIRTEVNPTP